MTAKRRPTLASRINLKGPYPGEDDVLKLIRAELDRLARGVRLKRKAECNKQLKACSRCYCQAMDNVLDLIKEAKR